jgi:hypothetical protein
MVPARTVYLASGALGVVSTFGVAFSDAFLPVLVLQPLAFGGAVDGVRSGVINWQGRTLTTVVPRESAVSACYAKRTVSGNVCFRGQDEPFIAAPSQVA